MAKRCSLTLSRDLTRLHGRGFSRSNLVYMRLLYLRYPISQKLSDLLSRSHFRQIAALDDAIKRDFYIELCRLEHWSVRQLQERMNSMLYERSAKPSACSA